MKEKETKEPSDFLKTINTSRDDVATRQAE